MNTDTDVNIKDIQQCGCSTVRIGKCSQLQFVLAALWFCDWYLLDRNYNHYVHTPTQEVFRATAFFYLFIFYFFLSISIIPPPSPPFQVPLVPLLEVWCTLGGGELYVPALLEHSYCMLEELQEVIILKEEEGQTIFACQNNRNFLPTLLEHRADELIYMGQSTRQLGLKLDHWGLFMTTTFHVQFVMLQHEKLL